MHGVPLPSLASAGAGGGGGGGGGGDGYREGEVGEEDLHDTDGVMIPGRAGRVEGDEGEEEEEEGEEEEGGDPALMSYTYPRRPRLEQRPQERGEMRAVQGSDREAGGFWGTGETAWL